MKMNEIQSIPIRQGWVCCTCSVVNNVEHCPNCDERKYSIPLGLWLEHMELEQMGVSNARH